VPYFCFEEPDNRIRNPNQGVTKWTYNSDTADCTQFLWRGNDIRQKNIFNSTEDCNKICRSPDLATCAHHFHSRCKHGDDLYYWYDKQREECRALRSLECPSNGNGFYTLGDCYRRCGRFVKDKCKLPIQNMTFCRTYERRYGYNIFTKRCEAFQGCEGVGNNFPTAKQCWETCATSGHRCVQKPDYKAIGFVPAYYYDINSHTCVKKFLFRGRVSGKSNLFNSMEECKAACMCK
ncbi:unnamed protein product, partial [Ixodes hexagonus]